MHNHTINNLKHIKYKMMNIKTFSLLVLQTALVCGADIQQQTRPNFYYTENFTLPTNIASKDFTLSITGRQLLSQKDRVESLIKAAQAQQKVLTLAVNVTKGDGLVDEHGCLKMSKDQIPSNLTSLIIQNTAQDVMSIIPYFLADCTGLKSLNFTRFNNLPSTKDNFFAGCIGFTNLTLPLTYKGIVCKLRK